MTQRRRPPIAFAAVAVATFSLAGFAARPPAAKKAGPVAGGEVAPALPAGKFTTGEGGIRGPGELVSFPSSGRYRLVWGTCVKPDSVSTGRAVVRDGLLILRTRGGKDDVLTPVEWGARQYLVRDLLGFVNDVNAGIRASDG